MLSEFPLIIADESVDGRIIRALKTTGYAVYSIIGEMPGISDSMVIEIAVGKQGYIIAENKDFGDELVYRNVQKIAACFEYFRCSDRVKSEIGI